jgi:uncharacterized protein (TIGR03790 family)
MMAGWINAMIISRKNPEAPGRPCSFIRLRGREREGNRTVRLQHSFLLLFVLLFPAGVFSARADSGAEVVVVYNTRVPESKNVAEYYASRRHVPANQMVGFSLSAGEEMSRDEFRDSLQKPLAKWLEEKNLWHIRLRTVPPTNDIPGRIEWVVITSKIRYAVLCYGVPVRIAPDPNLNENTPENLRPEFRRNEAAVDSELALLPLIEQNPPLTGPWKNPLYGATNSAWLHPTNGILLVARLDGPSAMIVRGLVDKAIQAETGGLWGRAYFDLRNTSDPGYKIGDDMIRAAAEVCRRSGFETVVDNNPETFPPEFPMSQIAFYCGWYDGNVSGPFTRPNVEFMPGAFAYHLHSFSAANVRSATQNWVGPLLAKGATITMGCVYEPYLSGTPDIAVFLSRLVSSGFTFGEAAYAGQSVLSWQTTVIGDPLYRPFGKSPPQLHQELEKKHDKLIEWSYLRAVNMNLFKGRPVSEVAQYLEQLEATKQSAVLTEKLADLYAALGKPESAIETYQRALRLNPSPQQRVRLRVTLGEKLIAVDPGENMNKYKDALEDYEGLLRENPDYPNKLDIYQKLLPIAQTLNNKEAVEKYEDEIKRLTPPPARQGPT